jgi:lipoyl-dependent peroxiredoxin
VKTLYSASATTSGGRDGHVESSDGELALDLTIPEGLGGKGGSGTNPEQLFAAGYSACFESALRLVARQQKKDVGDASVRANVDIGQTDDGGFGLAVELVGHLPELPREEAQALMEEAHQVCPYSRATRGNIAVKLSVEG